MLETILGLSLLTLPFMAVIIVALERAATREVDGAHSKEKGRLSASSTASKSMFRI
jgi:hypothetical protein